jgi:hypothetical protein
MASELENKKLQTLLRNNPDESEGFYADKLGIERTKIGPMIWFNEPLANPKLKFTGNKANIVKARKDGIRWERIAARTGKSVAECKEIGGKEAANVYVGRGRPPGNGSGTGKASSGRRQSAAKGKGTSGRRQAASKGNTGRGGKPRARTRAERLAKSGDPS